MKTHRHRPWVLYLVFAIFLALMPKVAFAIVAPDDLIIESVTSYTGVLQDDDLLVIVKYDIDYASLPTENVSEAFIGRFLRDTTDLNATELFPFNDRGFNEGVFSFYWTASQRSADSVEHGNPNSENYIIRLSGKVGVFPGGVPTISTSTITYQTTGTDLRPDIIELASVLSFDADWIAGQGSLITTGDRTLFTTNGGTYFGTVISRLANMRGGVGTLFESSVAVVLPVTRVPENQYKQDLDSFWDGTWFDTNTQRIADNYRLSQIVVTTIIAFLFMMTVAFGVAVLLNSTDRAIEFGMMTFGVTLPLSAAVKLVALEVVMVAGLMALTGLGWAFFGRKA